MKIMKIKFRFYVLWENNKKVVPSLYSDVKGNQYHAHQFTVNSNTVNIASLSAVYFKLKLI